MAVAAVLAMIAPVRADDPGPAPETSKPVVTKDGVPDPSIATSLPPTLGGVAGLRQALADHGFQFGINYIGEVLGNTSGGIRQGAIYDGRLELVLDGDLGRTFGLNGLFLHANAFQYHGRGLSRFNIGDVEPTSSIEALPSTRLSEVWLEQKFAGDTLGIRIGQLAADQEFITTFFGAPYVNGTFGWPTITAVDLPSTGPAYPFAAPGVRVRWDPSRNFTVLAAVFDGDPAGPPGLFKDPDPRNRNHDGLRFRLKDPPLVIAEVQGRYEIAGLAGTAKIGGWHHFGTFGDVRFGTDLLSLADPGTNGVPIPRRGNNGIYGVLDQQIYALPDGGPTKGIGIFLRGSASPGDRNLVDFYVDGGVTATGMVPGRANDTIGLAGGYVGFSRRARELDRDVARFGGLPTPVRTAEVTGETTYIYQVFDGFSLQPNAQYVVRPAGGIVNPRDALGVRRIHNAAIFGLRTLVRF